MIKTIKSYGLITLSSITLTTLSFATDNTNQGMIKVNNKPNMQLAQNNPTQYTPRQSIPTIIPEPPKIRLNAASWVLMDFQTGEILTEKNMNKEHKPASLTKILAAYVIGQALHDGMIKWGETVPISKKAWKTPGSKMFIKPSDHLTVGDLFKGMVISSGNDATVALAEFVAGSEEAFVQLMNHAAKQLGMNHSHFVTSDGLPAKNQYSTAYDLAILSRAYIHTFPDLYKLYSQKSFTFNGITQHNRNRLLNNETGVDGIKTGYTDQAGFNLASSQIKDGRRLIAIVLGAPSDNARTEESNKLLTYGFRFFENYDIADSTKKIAKLQIDNAETYQYQLPVTVKNDLIVTLAKGQNKLIHLNVTANKDLKAPIKKGQQVGTLTVTFKGKTLATTPVYALESVEKAGFFTNIGHTIRGWF
ncbi:D-alanyl-D-alanine carboxypeptidase [Thiotrichales bacterium 19S3-7]|nr:D-alanyl-D-alanine carboxypeptidase [Thiotrichales bacterium 19S3-7]MCF6802026.1 D-alanyl-D-alanine carboxypeptidase [Thiotrichales bacterium 19S3-11]